MFASFFWAFSRFFSAWDFPNESRRSSPNPGRTQPLFRNQDRFSRYQLLRLGGRKHCGGDFSIERMSITRALEFEVIIVAGLIYAARMATGKGGRR
jgi:hypothetical protein